MKTFPLKSSIIKPNEDLNKIILQVLKKNKISLKNGDVLVVTSKIVALCQGRIVHEKFMNAVKREAEKIFHPVKKNLALTLKNGILIPNAGIDLSNAKKGYAILWPEKPWVSAALLRSYLRKKFRLKKIGVIISDSHCNPLRWGTTGLALAYAGFYGVEDARGEKDIFGKPLRVTKIAAADNLASAALLDMREAGEKIPFVIIRNAKVKFSTKKFSSKDTAISPRKCIFTPLYPRVLKKQRARCRKHQGQGGAD